MATTQVFLHNKYMVPGESTAGGGVEMITS